MTLTPKIIGPDGVARENFIFTTTISQRFFQGTIDASTVDMQISVRGEPFTSNPDLIVFEGESFTIPNSSVFPDGLDLAPGVNVIEVRAISFSGAVSPAARMEVTLVQESDVDYIPSPPTNITMERYDEEVEIRVQMPSDDRVRGVNFYASQFSGGGATGYQRINLDLVQDTFTQEETTTIHTLEVDSAIATNPDGTPAADPLYVQLRETQTKGGDTIEKLEDVTLTEELAAAITYNEQENLLKTDFLDVFEVAETVTNIRTSVTIDSVTEAVFARFRHNRINGPTSQPPTVAIGEFASTPMTEPLYYVVTAVAFDEAAQIETESAFSIEVFGNPVTVSLQVGAFPVVSRSDITQVTISNILRTNPTQALQPGAVIRDTVIDPDASEQERVRFIVDFLHRAQSFDSLLRVDGIDANGNPIPVQNSAYKQALQRAFGNITVTQTQSIIDAAFEQLAAQVGVSRRPGIRSRGLETFFTTTRPTQTIQIPLGTRVAVGGTLFGTTQASSIPLESAASFFNPTTGLFTIDIPIRADEPGTQGNVARGQIRTLLDPIGGLQVVNPGPTFGGRNVETNLELATRARNALASVDSGTEAGYRQTMADIPGVEQAVVVTSGNTLMQRDFDTTSGKHVGGKVDIYVRGEALATVTDTFAFSFEIANNVQFKVLGNPTELKFEAIDDTLSVDNPIAEMLDFPDAGLGLRNATQGALYDLTDVQILDYKTIQLSDAVPQPVVTALSDVILGDYRYVVSRKFVLPRQPVREVLTVTGAVTGVLDEDNYRVFQTDSPLLDGRSTEAQTYIQIDEVNGQPTGEFISIEDEQHVIIGEFPESLFYLGANILTIKVYNESRTVLFRGPFDPSGISDYTILPGSQTTPAQIKRVEGGAILSGQRISIDYSHDENFVVEYTINLAVRSAQEIIDEDKHATADVLIKETIPVPVDRTATVIKEAGEFTSTVDRGVRSNLAAFYSVLALGTSVRQSDEVAEIERTDGVSYVEIPFTKLARQPGSSVLRESLTTAQNADLEYLSSLSSDTVLVWLIKDALNAATTTGGGDETEFREVTQDDLAMELQVAVLSAIGAGPGRAYIIGDDGASIPGYTDDVTLEAEFPTATAQERNEVRRDRTANRVVISLAVGDSPTNHEYTATYIVGETNAGVKNLDAFDIEYFMLGAVNLTIDEDQQ